MEELLTVSEVAKELGRSPGTIRRWISLGFIEALTLPNSGVGKVPHYRIKKATVAAIKQRKHHMPWPFA